MSWVCQFEVTGCLPFPLDMLRYDSCYPARGEDAAAIADTFDSQRRELLNDLPGHCFRVRLAIASPTKRVPTRERWSSFLWGVDPTTVTYSKV